MEDYEIIEKENEEYLKIFRKYLHEEGLNEKTINRHINHVDYYINNYLLIGMPQKMEKGCSFDACNFIESYVNERVIPASKNNVNLFSTSILKFYKCMLKNGFVEEKDFDDLKWSLSECKDEMIEDYFMKNPNTIDLNKVIDCIEASGDIETFYLNKYSGEILSVLQDESLMDEEYREEVFDKLDNYDAWIEMPGQNELNEYYIMESFAQNIINNEQRDKLLYVLNGKKPFRRFKDEINYLGIANNYYSYRRDKIEQVAIKWLNNNEISYK